jgi:anaerobic selenocysteine-containing dehydrogenase
LVLSVSIFGKPLETPSSLTVAFKAFSNVISSSVFHAMPLPPLPILLIKGPKEVPSATWYEKNDLNTSDMHPFIHPLSKAVDPAWESRSDWEIYKGLTIANLAH